MATASAPASTQPARPTEVMIYSHSNLFYWWPVWLIGLVLGLLTMIGKEKMVIVPGDAKASRELTVVLDPVNKKNETAVREGILFEPAPFDKTALRKHLPPNLDEKDLKEPAKLTLHGTSHKGYGVIFATVLLVVIFITNVPLRGMWSVLIIMAIMMLSIIFALAGWWDNILGAIALLDIRLNTGGYFFIALGLLGLWLFAFFFFDRQLYVTFSPGAMKVCLEIGSGEKQYDTIGMSIEKERSDLFRHWILGLGSGDLVIRTSGADRHEFRLQNVLFINRKKAAIEDMQRVRQERTS